VCPDLDAEDIIVVVDEGVVTLTGEVDDRSSKRIAEDLAEQAPGVKDVNNQLKPKHTLLDNLRNVFGGSGQSQQGQKQDRTSYAGSSSQSQQSGSQSGQQSGQETRGQEQRGQEQKGQESQSSQQGSETRSRTTRATSNT
jgi:hypothetical protein